MSEPLVLVVLLGAADPTTEAMMASTRRALGPEAIVLAETSESSTDHDALAIGERVHARAVARVDWVDGTLTVVRIHVHVAPSDEWADEQVSFSPRDASSEKGRTIGYTVASMVQRLELTREESRAEVEPAPPPVPTRAAAPAEAPVVTLAPPERSRGLDLDLFVHAIGSLGDPAALGGSGGVRWWPARHLGLRAALGGRTGRIPEIDASTLALFCSAGPGLQTSIDTTFVLGARADFVLYRYSVARPQGGLELTHQRWLGAIDFVFEASWALSERAAVVGGVGAELAFGTTAVNVGGVNVAEVPPVRGIAEVGGRIRF